MSQQWSSKTTSYRLYCQGCDAQTVVHDDEIDGSDWRVTSLHFHEGECPECARATIDEADEPAPVEAAADGGQPTLEAFEDCDSSGGGR